MREPTLETSTIDHVIPCSQGGPSTEANLVLVCRRCNRRKGNTRYADVVVHRRPCEGVLDESRRIGAAIHARRLAARHSSAAETIAPGRET